MPLNLSSITNWNSDQFIVKNISNEFLSIGDLKVYLAPGHQRDLLEQNTLTKIKSRNFPEIVKSKDIHIFLKLGKIEIYDEHGLISGEENASNLFTYTSAYDVAGVSSTITIINSDSSEIVNGEYTVKPSDSSLLIDTTLTLLLPDAATIENKIYYIKNIGTGVLTVKADETQTIDGGNTAVLENQYESITIISDGENFYIH